MQTDRGATTDTFTKLSCVTVIELELAALEAVVAQIDALSVDTLTGTGIHPPMAASVAETFTLHRVMFRKNQTPS